MGLREVLDMRNENEVENIHHDKVEALQYLLLDLNYRRPHLHFDLEIVVVLSGNGTVKTQNNAFSMTAGQAIIFNSCQVHELSSSEGVKLLILQFSPSIFEFALPELDKMNFESRPFTVKSDSDFLHYMFKSATSYFLAQGYYRLETQGFAALAFAEFLKLCPHVTYSSSEQDKILDLQERIQRISSHIRANFTSKITLEELAEREGYSRTYFSQFFKKAFGITFKEYLDNIRCEKAQSLLLHSQENLLNITYLCGFSDIRTLNKAFSKYYGVSPKAYRLSQGKSLEQPAELAEGVDRQVFYDENDSVAYLTQL